VLGSLPREQVSEFLSGLLIGAEVATLSQRFRDQQVTIVAGETLANRYQQALTPLAVRPPWCRATRISDRNKEHHPCSGKLTYRLSLSCAGLRRKRRWRTWGRRSTPDSTPLKFRSTHRSGKKSIPAVVEAYGDKALIGAGTVLNAEQVDQLARMGCRLIVTPNIQPEVIRRAVSYGMTVCPGCATATKRSPRWMPGRRR
jgi:hypothetical protein